MTMRFISFCLTLASATYLFFQIADPNIEKLTQQLAEWNKAYPEEKIYIHTDKPYYSLGDTIWYKLYLVNGQTLSTDSLSNLVYVELIDEENNILAKRNQMLFWGGSAGEIGLAANSWKPGVYQLRAFTKFMQNQEGRYTFQKEILILDQNLVAEQSEKLIESTETTALADRLDVQFMPESGQLVNGLQTMVGIKALDAKTGLSIEVEGELKDDQGNMVTTFQTFRNGLGKFSLKPDMKLNYVASIYINDERVEVAFPKVEEKGSILLVAPKNEKILVTMRTNVPDGLQGGYLVSSMNSVVVAHSQIKKKGGEFAILLNKQSFNEGVMHITLFDKKLVPQAERLVFMEKNENSFDPVVTSNKNSYANREKVTLSVDLRDTDFEVGGPQANVSISVTDQNAVRPLENEENIKTYLLLSSEVTGKIENPGYYFIDDDPKRKRLLDILMLTQGWRRFEWNEVLSNKPKRRRPKMEEGFTIEGYISKFEKPDVPIEGFVSISSIGDMFYHDDKRTTKTGKFRFDNVPVFDTTGFVLQARIPNGKSSRTKDMMDGKKWNSIHLYDPYRPVIQRDENFATPFQNVADMISFVSSTEKQQDLMNSFGMSIELDEITISRTKVEKKSSYDRDYQLYSSPDNRLILDSIRGSQSYLSIFQLVRSRVPGVEIFGTYPNEIAIIRGFTSIQGSNEALYMIDGVPVDAATLSNVPISSISHIDVLKGARAAIYGGGAQNGIIMVNRKDGSQQRAEEHVPGIENYLHPGPYITRKFYAPKYDGSLESSGIGVDIRNTLFWDPFVVTDSLGQAQIEFYTCDISSTYHVDIQGITFDGRPVVVKGEVVVK